MTNVYRILDLRTTNWFTGFMTNATAAPKGETPAKDASPRAPHACACLAGTGKTCDKTTQKVFAQGHDARMASRLAQDVAAGKTTAEAAEKIMKDAGGSGLLIGKMKHSAKLRATAGDKPAKPRATKAKAVKATDEQVAAMTASAENKGAQFIGRKTKVPHGSRDFDAVIVRNVAGDAVARHRLTGQNCDHSVDDKGNPGEKIR